MTDDEVLALATHPGAPMAIVPKGTLFSLLDRAQRAEAELAALRRAGRDGNGAMNAIEILTADRDDWKRRAERAEAERDEAIRERNEARAMITIARASARREAGVEERERCAQICDKVARRHGIAYGGGIALSCAEAIREITKGGAETAKGTR